MSGVPEAQVALDSVTRRYGETTAVDSLTLQAFDGELLVLLGPSGCGKSTVLRLVAGLERPTSGTVSIGGEDVTEREARNRDVAMVFQSYALYPHLTVRKNIAFPLRARHVPQPERDSAVAEVARALQLEPYLDRRPSQLSGGQRQRVALARVILKDAPILVLDEATSALDSEIEQAIQENLQALMAGKTVIAIAHRLSTIAAMDRLVVLDGGRIVETGSHRELIARDGLYAALWRRQSGGFLKAAE